MPPNFTIADAQLNVEHIRLYVERFKAAHRIELRSEFHADILRDIAEHPQTTSKQHYAPPA